MVSGGKSMIATSWVLLLFKVKMMWEIPAKKCTWSRDVYVVSSEGKCNSNAPELRLVYSNDSILF